jgi:hypothetical protein
MEIRCQGAPTLAFDTWLQKLYDRKSERFIQDNERIWRTGAIFIPTSLAGLAVFPAALQHEPLAILPVAFASVLVMLLWVSIAEQHRLFQDGHQMWLTAIESRLGITPMLGKPDLRGPPSRWIAALPTVQKARYLLAVCTLWLWGVCAVGAVVVEIVKLRAG